MQPYETFRIGHAERDAVIERLATAYAEGRIDAREFDQRSTAALNARTQTELAPLLADLPGQVVGWRQRPLGRPATPPLESTSADRAWGMLAHFSGWFLFFVGPLLVLVVKGRSPGYVRQQAAEALNFQLSFLGLNLLLIVGAIMTLGLAALLYPVIWLAWTVLVLIGGIASLAGSPFRYPLTLRMIR
jgi:uncharacterized Tic20 family protein